MKHRFFRKVFCAVLTVTVGVTACGCVNQHPDSTPTDITAENARLVATSPAVATPAVSAVIIFPDEFSTAIMSAKSLVAIMLVKS